MPTNGLMEGMEAGSQDRRLAMPQFKFTWGHAAKDGSTDDMGKTSLASP